MPLLYDVATKDSISMYREAATLPLDDVLKEGESS